MRFSFNGRSGLAVWGLLVALVLVPGCDSHFIGGPVDINDADIDGLTPLECGVFKGRMDTAKVLLENGANIDGRGVATKWTALHYAVNCHNAEMLIFLLDRGANPNLADNKGWTPLHYAVYNTYYHDAQMAEILISHKADVNAKTNDGQSPLAIARDRHSDAVEDLLKKNGGR